ncbi:hypothetical protein TVAG_173370 [Trichomonas vaginalis G3]|uniref:Uncharacterized protein n=1 Tax=Trichomonas vaginalis (strain ATCC PRA-98 / G3) TaxID=412133 RepID=A2G3H0_TRIV3|nr:hypothetical protein TVAGG3_0735460 [Trichomonas vaginalis G3]EAX88298.1 hypothetical protein TVAG_173370 [Trichomonas vaginalis G3]KAI5511548.1 hypothetical protein TVAGG3_0735460 [Trichomonas vaginalis G3]|eukprot:XP_001301228.1 hypothetical protein [Trichomonas vaginalis G3]
MVTEFLNSVKTCPGAIIGVNIEELKPPRDWKWSNVSFPLPETPIEVHKMLCDRQDLIMKSIKVRSFKNSPKCRHQGCNEVANMVCAKCRKLVLCKNHCHDGEKCPICGNPIKVI